MKTPIHDNTVEQNILGSFLIEPKIIPDWIDEIRVDDFYKTAHKTVFKAIVTLLKSQEVDYITLTNYLRDKGALNDLGGAVYLSQLINIAVTPANINSNVKILLSMSKIRHCEEILHKGLIEIRKNTLEPDEIIENLTTNLLNIRQSNDVEIPHVRDIIKTVIDEIEMAAKGEIKGIMTGFDDIDKFFRGIRPQEVVILAGRPGMGKTALSLSIINNIAADNSIAFFSLEMSKEDLLQRLFSIETGINTLSMREGKLQKHEWSKFMHAGGKFSEINLHIDDKLRELSKIKKACKRLKAKNELDLIIIDYLQLIIMSKSNSSTYEKTSAISQNLKGLAKDLDVPILCLAQLNRSCESRQDKRPMLSDLRDSGAIEQDADKVIFVYRGSVYGEKTQDAYGGLSESSEDLAEIIIAKNRSGRTGFLELTFEGQFTRFSNREEF